MKHIRTAGLVLFIFISFGFALPAHAFNQPWAINMGITSFLDGGPDQPRHGLFFNQYLVLVQSDGFLDENGDKVEAIPPLSIPSIGVDMNNWISLSQFIYFRKNGSWVQISVRNLAYPMWTLILNTTVPRPQITCPVINQRSQIPSSAPFFNGTRSNLTTE